MFTGVKPDNSLVHSPTNILVVLMEQDGGGISLTSLTLPHFCACPKPGPGFLMSYVVVFFMFNELR